MAETGGDGTVRAAAILVCGILEGWSFGDAGREVSVVAGGILSVVYPTLIYWLISLYFLRTTWMQYPKIPELYFVDDQYLIGSDLLVKPVTSAGTATSKVQFPLSDCRYDVDTMQRMKLKGDVKTVSITVSSDFDKIPIYQRGGSVVPRKLRLRRSSHLTMNDPYTL